MAKPSYGTLIGSNSLTASLRAAYLLNGASMSTLINSVGGAEALTHFVFSGAGSVIDGATDSVQFVPSSWLSLPSAVTADMAGLSEATLMLSFKGNGTGTAASLMGQTSLNSGQGDYWPFSNGLIYSSQFVNSRYNAMDPLGVDLTTGFRQIVITVKFSGSWKLYLDNVLKSTQTPAGSSTTFPSSFAFGHNCDGTYLDGRIQYVYLWTRELNSTEIGTLFADPYSPIFTGGAAVTQPIMQVIC